MVLLYLLATPDSGRGEEGEEEGRVNEVSEIKGLNGTTVLVGDS